MGLSSRRCERKECRPRLNDIPCCISHRLTRNIIHWAEGGRGAIRWRVQAARYRQGDLPVTEDVYPRLIAIPSWDRAVPCEDLHQQYAEAIRKVSRNLGSLQPRLAFDSRPSV